MRRFSLVVAIFILLQCIGWSQSSDIPPDDVRFDRGTIANGTYTNECFGVSLSIPEGWEVSTIPGVASGRALHLPGGGLGLLILGRHREKGFGDQITLNANDAGRYPTWTVQSFVSASAQSAVSTDPQRRELIRDAFAVEYGGRQFYRADYKQSLSNGTTLYLAYVYTKFGGYFVGATLSTVSPETLNEAADSLRRISFHRDSPNPSCVIGPNDGPLMGVVGSVRSSSSGAVGVSRVRVSQGVSQGLLIKRVQPDYPEAARQGHIEGTVVLQTIIDANGNVEEVTVTSGPPLLAPTAVDAVKQWKYKPYTFNGQPVKIETQVVVPFQLPPN
ncbi:MAG: energy transducer TonB [Candidatus Sulfotelmatobacter sp.]